MWNIEISKWEGREEWPLTGLFLDVSCHRKTFWSGQNLSFLQFRYFTFPYIFRLGSLFGSIFQAGTRIIENHDDFHSTREAVAAVVVLSNFEANRSSNENSRVGSPDLVRELKSGTGTQNSTALNPHHEKSTVAEPHRRYCHFSKKTREMCHFSLKNQKCVISL